MTPLRTTKAREIRATLLRAAEIALQADCLWDDPNAWTWDAIWLAHRKDGYYINSANHYKAVIGGSYRVRQRNCWALLFAAAAVED